MILFLSFVIAYSRDLVNLMLINKFESLFTFLEHSITMKCVTV